MQAMGAHVTRANADAGEHSIMAVFSHENLSPQRWSNGPGDTYAAHNHPYHKVLYCVRGSIVFRLSQSGEAIELRAGDRLDIEPGTEHSAIVGAHGVECVEAAR
jgi:quercetin dioxygenase-like cupin family protein